MWEDSEVLVVTAVAAGLSSWFLSFAAAVAMDATTDAANC